MKQQMDVSVAVKERATGSLNASAGWSQDDGLILWRASRKTICSVRANPLR